MPLARLQWLFLAFSLALLTALTAILVQNQIAVARSLADLTQAQELLRTVVRMSNIAVEVTTNLTDRQEIQWQAGMREFAHTLHPLQTAFADQATLIEAIGVDVKDVDELFR